jgi:hypothetical protein
MDRRDGRGDAAADGVDTTWKVESILICAGAAEVGPERA